MSGTLRISSNQPFMKTIQFNCIRITAVFAALLVLAGAKSLVAQESLIALGNVNTSGELDVSENTVGGVVASSRLGEGDYQVTVSAAGAFAGAVAGDFHLLASIESTASGDTTVNASVTSVTNDILTVNFTTGDVEDTTSSFLAEARDAAVFFLIRRVDSSSAIAEGDSRYLMASGVVNSGGTIASATGIDGVVVTSLRADTGDYFITLTKVGHFTADTTGSYVILLTPLGSSESDIAIRGDVVTASSDDSISINVHTDDVQAAVAADAAVPANTTFFFAAYRIDPASVAGVPASRLNALNASVTSGGVLTFGQSTIPGATVTASRPATGRYQVDITASNAFAGVDPDRFAPILTINSTSLIDELAKANVSFPDANTLRVEVFIDDAQATGDADGLATNAAFFLSLYDTEAVLLHDLSLSRSTDPATLRGVGVINQTAAGQSVRVPLEGIKRKSVFYTSGNAGTVVDDLRLKSRGISNTVEARFFRISGPRTNVTANFQIGAVSAEGVRPDERIKFEGVFRYKTTANRPGRDVFVGSRGNTASFRRDEVLAKLRP
jgi:hypothetical protein